MIDTIEIDGKRYYILPDGTKLPSVTTILGATPNQHLIEWEKAIGTKEANRVKGLATRKGTQLHKLIEMNLKNEQQVNDIMPDVLELYRQFLKVKHNITKILTLEEAVYSLKLKMAGRVDCVCEWNHKPSILDFKSANFVREDIQSYYEQATAYALMYSELYSVKITQIIIMVMSPGLQQPHIYIEHPSNFINSLIKKRNEFYKNEQIN